jgi:probable rRNA maturation factor
MTARMVIRGREDAVLSDLVELDLQDEAGDEAGPAPTAASFERWVEAARVGAGRVEPVELTVRLVTEEEGRALNQGYRGKDRPTNVLSFEADLPDDLDLPFIGDIVICPAVMAREATEQGKDPEAHWAHLTVHGVLHLLGYDHQDETDATAMESLEVQILEGLGYPDPYQTADAAARS